MRAAKYFHHAAREPLMDVHAHNCRTCCFSLAIKVNRQQSKSVGSRPMQKIVTPIKWLISPFPEVINQICKKHSSENSYDKKTNNETCNIFQT